MTRPATPRRRPAVAVEVHNTGLLAAYGFDETSGTTAVDALAHRNGTIIGGPARVTGGRFGGALSFDGTDDMVSVPHDTALNLNSGMTLEAWVRPSALGTIRSVVMKERPGSFDYGLFADNDVQRTRGQRLHDVRYAGVRACGARPRHLDAPRPDLGRHDAAPVRGRRRGGEPGRRPARW